MYQQHEKELTLTGNISKFSMYLKVCVCSWFQRVLQHGDSMCATRPCDAGHVARSQVVGGIELLVTIGLMLNKVWFANFTGLVLGVMAIQVGAVMLRHGARLSRQHPHRVV